MNTDNALEHVTRISPPVDQGAPGSAVAVATAVPPAADITLHFELSQDEEHARLSAQVGSLLIDLGERVHHYSLATLARLRLRDDQQGHDPHSQGWVALDDLARMLGVDASYLNIQIFRARGQFANALPLRVHAPLLVERRRGEVRLGGYSFRIRRGSALEGSFTARGMRSPG